MSGDKILAEEPWSYVMFQRGDRVLLTLLSGGAVAVDQTVIVPDQQAVTLASSPPQLRAYVQTLLSNRDELCSRRLPVPVWPE